MCGGFYRTRSLCGSAILTETTAHLCLASNVTAVAATGEICCASVCPSHCVQGRHTLVSASRHPSTTPASVACNLMLSTKDVIYFLT